VYIHVSDVDAVHAEWTASGVEGRFGEVQETEYEMREFGYIDRTERSTVLALGSTSLNVPPRCRTSSSPRRAVSVVHVVRKSVARVPRKRTSRGQER
jgi:hypothetical protein